MSQLSYYFNNQSSFYYSSDGQKILNGDVIQITMPNNNSSQSVMKLIDNGITSYYTLNSMYISLNINSSIDSMYQLIIQGNKNDYTDNAINQILIILPIFNSVDNTLEGTLNAITRINNIYISSLFNNITLSDKEPYMFSYGSNNQSEGININQFLDNNNTANIYRNITDFNINYNIIHFQKSNFWIEKLPQISLLNNLLMKPKLPSTAPNSITIANNSGPITTISESDIYIDCSPTNNIGEPVDIYTSKNLDQLNFFKINDLKVWAFRFITIFIIVLIIFIIIKIFQISENGNKKITPSEPTL